MGLLAEGTEQNDWNLAASEQLEIDGSSVSYNLASDALIKVEVQLGNTANPLHGDGGILAVTIKLTPSDTGDQCVMQQKQMNVVAGDTCVLLSCDPFWAESGSAIEVHAKSSNSNDSVVGGKVWLADITPAAAGDNMALVDDAISASKFDESTAFPVTVAMKEAGEVIVRGTVDSSNFAPTTTEFEASNITEPASDHYKGRIIIFVNSSGLRYQATDITAYSLVGGKGHFTVTALTSAPSNGDTFVIV